jgi:alpha-D-ribose 1-methylphosphonate 5-triphosphate diphosphatase
LLLTNARVVTPERVLDSGSVAIESGVIVEIADHAYPAGTDALDLRGRYLLPGLVDLHSDAYERQLNPRPGAAFPPVLAFLHYDRQLAAAGVTTQFHAVSFSHEDSFGRSLEEATAACAAIHALRASGSATIDHQILHRLELRTPGAWEAILAELGRIDAAGMIPFISLDDHVLGRGQLRNRTAFLSQIRSFLPAGLSEAEMEIEIDRRMAEAEQGDEMALATLNKVGATIGERSLIVAAHDPESTERIDQMMELGAKIAEFPTTIEAALYAAERGLPVVVGAPNVLRGRSLLGNVSGLDLIQKRAAGIMVADYYGQALLAAAAGIAAREVRSLPEAIRMVTLHPADAVGLTDRGAIVPGLRADLVVADLERSFPEVSAAFTGGRLGYAAAGFAADLGRASSGQSFTNQADARRFNGSPSV